MSQPKSLMEIFLETIETALEKEIENAETEEKAREILNHFESADVEKIFNNFLSTVTKNTFSFIKTTMFEEVMRFRADEQEFLARQEQRWYRAFVASEAMYIMTLAAAEAYSKYIESLPKDEFQPKYWTYIAMKYIHGRAMQEFLEIITLMKNGFADGA